MRSMSSSVARSGDRLAISVKLCDLLDHLDPAINAGLTDVKVGAVSRRVAIVDRGFAGAERE